MLLFLEDLISFHSNVHAFLSEGVFTEVTRPFFVLVVPRANVNASADSIAMYLIKHDLKQIKIYGNFL